MDIIIEQTNKIFSKAIARYAKQSQAEYVSILFRLDDGDELVYEIGYDHAPALQVGFMDILGVKIDIKMYSIFVPPAIKKILKKFQTEFGTKDVVVTVYLDESDDSEVSYFVFADAVCKRKFDLAEVIEFDLEQVK